MAHRSVGLIAKLWLLAVVSGLVVPCMAVPPAKPPTDDPTYGLSQLRTPSKAKAIPDWIWAAHTDAIQTIYVRGIFDLSRTPQKALLVATADDYFTLFVNGHRLGSVTSGAEASVWRHDKILDVTPYLQRGRNVVAIQARNDGGGAGVVAQLDVDDQPALMTNTTWHVWDAPTLPDNWNTASYDDAAWQTATVITPLGGDPWGLNLETWLDNELDVPYLAHLALEPVSVKALSGVVSGTGPVAGAGPVALRVAPAPDPAKPAAVLLDFGKELAGRLEITGTDGEPIIINTGESLAEITYPVPANDNSGPYSLTLSGREPITTPYSGFRYARLIFPGTHPVTITRVICDDKYYPVVYKGAFSCSDPLLTKIWYTGAYTTHACMQEDILDAVKRDHALWIGDVNVSGEVINDVFGDTFLMEHTLTHARQTTQGGLPATAVATGDINGIPGYSAAWICTLADFYRHMGDIGYLRSQHDLILSQLAYEQTDFENNLFTNPHQAWPFVDWAKGFNVASPEALEATDLFLVKGVRDAVFLLREMGDTANADKYGAWADTLTSAARETYFEPRSGTYGPHLQENAMAIDSGVATPVQAQSIFRAVLQAGSPAWRADTAAPGIVEAEPISPYYGNYVLLAMGAAGHNQAGIDLMRRYWGDMLRRGSTTWWEFFDPSFPDDMAKVLPKLAFLSLCHGWSSGPTSYLTEYVLGVRPTGAGFKTAVISPNLGDLTWAEGSVPTPRGLLRVRVQKQGAGLHMRVVLPAGVITTVDIPGTSFFLNGVAVKTAALLSGQRLLILPKPGTYLIDAR